MRVARTITGMDYIIRGKSIQSSASSERMPMNGEGGEHKRKRHRWYKRAKTRQTVIMVALIIGVSLLGGLIVVYVLSSAGRSGDIPAIAY